MLEQLLEYDKELLIYLNSLGNQSWDSFWLFVTKQFYWIPFFALLLYFVFKAYGWKKGLVIMLITAILVTFVDQFANFIKAYFGRVRPNNDATINSMLRVLSTPRSFSFASAHAMNSFATTTFLILTLKKYYKNVGFLLFWPLLFSYSRIYLGVHYPLDIFAGMVIGVFIGYLFYKISLFFLLKIH